MKNIIFCSYISFLILVSCNFNSKEPVNTISDPEEEIPKYAENISRALESENETFTIKLKFVDYELGDASHYTFEDESGEYWDFGECESSDFEFAIGLSEEDSSTDNQGWTSNKDLQGKWFVITYIIREQEEYIDGPVGKVQIITDVVMLED
ncbi:MAG: hypothetical protein MK207_09020 [Saprospiraceae bacterium]|nr:hypothetical protein [Saprospiraceae bacterium]